MCHFSYSKTPSCVWRRSLRFARLCCKCCNYKRKQSLRLTSKKGDASNFKIGTEFKFSTMQEHMSGMLLNANAFIALPGGILSLQEIMSIIFWANGNFHQKPLGFLNINHFYDGIPSYLNHAVEQGFKSQATQSIIVFVPTAKQILDWWQPAPVKLDQLNQHNVSDGELDTTLHLWSSYTSRWLSKEFLTLEIHQTQVVTSNGRVKSLKLLRCIFFLSSSIKGSNLVFCVMAIQC